MMAESMRGPLCRLALHLKDLGKRWHLSSMIRAGLRLRQAAVR